MLGSFVVLLISRTSCFLTTLHLPYGERATCNHGNTLITQTEYLNVTIKFYKSTRVLLFGKEQQQQQQQQQQ